MPSQTTTAPAPTISVAPAKGTLTHLNQRYSTALTATLGIVTCVTGAMLFFHAYRAQVTALHEWFGMGFVIATILHLIRHWKPFTHLMKQRRMHVLTGVVLLATAWFVVVAGTAKRENPMRAMGQTVSVMTRAPISALAPVFAMSADEAIARLTDAGLTGVDASQSVDDVAKKHNTTGMRVLTVLGSEALSPQANAAAAASTEGNAATR